MPSYRSKPVSNEVLMNFWETIGLLTDIKPTFHIKEIGMEDYSQTEKILNNLAKGWAKTSQFNRRMAFWTMFAMLTTAPARTRTGIRLPAAMGETRQMRTFPLRP